MERLRRVLGLSLGYGLILMSLAACQQPTEDEEAAAPAPAPSLPAAPAQSISGTYCIKWMETRPSELVITANDASIEVSGQPMTSPAPYTFDGTNLAFVGSIPAMNITGFTVNLVVSNGQNDVDGSWSLSMGNQIMTGSLYGSLGACAPVARNVADPLPTLVTADYIDLSTIDQITLFRSSMGHDYADDAESCRSMKHYFIPDAALDWSTIPIYAPDDVEISSVQSGWAGDEINLESLTDSDFTYRVFHMVLAPGLGAGDQVNAGQLIGYHVGNATWSDIAVHVNTTSGMRLVSYFNVMDASVFSGYQARGASSASDYIISQADRDSDPVSCSGETFTSSGSLPQYSPF